MRQSPKLSEPCWQPLLPNGNIHHTYRWRVRAEDSRGARTGWGETATFTLAPPIVNNPLPISTPPSLPSLPIVEGAIWNTNWTWYREIPLITDSSYPAGTLVKVDGLDLNTLVAAGKARSDFHDVRVVYQRDDTHWQEVARNVYTNWDLEFFLLEPLPAGETRRYFLVYGNQNAGAPPTYTMPQGLFVDLYEDKWGESWKQTISFDSMSVDFADVCSPPIDHVKRTGGSSFDDAEGIRGRIFIPVTGTWTFKTFMPDGYRFRLDRNLMGEFSGYSIAEWKTMATTELKAGWYDLDFHDMWVNCGPFKFTMAGPGFSEQIVPAQYFQKFWADTRHSTPGEEKAFDQTPPTTTATSTPTQPNGLAGWYVNPCTVSLSAVDNPNGTGVKETWFKINYGPWERYTTALVFAQDGIFDLTYYSVDHAGNQEQPQTVTIKLDQTAPSSLLTLDGTLGQAGWYTSTVSVIGNGFDPLPGSGLERLEWSLDGVLWQPYSTSIAYTQEGLGSVFLRAIDGAGNVQVHPTQVAIKLDTRVPDVVASLGAATYTRAQTVTVQASAFDPEPGSGIATLVSRLNGNPVTDGTVLELLFLPLGTYTLDVTATDVAGWQIHRTSSFELIATIEGLSETIPALQESGDITHNGIARALMQKIAAALAAKERGNVSAAVNILEALQRQIEAQTGKKISQQAADVLIADIEYIVNELQ